MSPDKTADKIIDALKHLSIEPLNELCDKLIYSYNEKQELIDELESVFGRIKSKGISRLSVKNSKCKYCYPNGAAYSFNHPETDEFIIRYVIFKENDNLYRVEECKNRLHPIREDGLPF